MTRRTPILVAVCSAASGAVAVLLVAWAAGWLHGEEHTVVVREAASPVEVANAPRVTPLIGGHFDPAAIYKGRGGGVVTIYSVFGSGSAASAAQGSGFVVSRDGVILTNSHVVTTAGEGAAPATPASRVYVEFKDRDRVAAKIVGWDVFDDVGVIKVDPKTHALGNENSLAVGVVSATLRSIESLTSQYNLVDAIQVDAPINHGNSGGPLFDALGRVIGINAQIRSDSGNAEGVGFAVPINAAKRSMAQLLANGKVSYAYVGITSEDLTPGIARRFGYPVEYGAVITSVRPGSPGARAGLHGGTDERDFNGVDFTYGGDVLVAVDGAPVRGANDVVRMVSEHLRPGQVSTFTIVRDGTRRRVRVVLGTRPGNPDAR